MRMGPLSNRIRRVLFHGLGWCLLFPCGIQPVFGSCLLLQGTSELQLDQSLSPQLCHALSSFQGLEIYPLLWLSTSDMTKTLEIIFPFHWWRN